MNGFFGYLLKDRQQVENFFKDRLKIKENQNIVGYVNLLYLKKKQYIFNRKQMKALFLLKKNKNKVCKESIDEKKILLQYMFKKYIDEEYFVYMM